MKTLLYVLLFALVMNQPLMADDLTDVSGLVKDKIGVVIRTLRDTKLEQRVKNKTVIRALTPVLDFRFMALMSIVKKYRVKLTKQQKTEYLDLFTERLQESFLEKLELYTDEEIVLRKTEYATRKGKVSKKKIKVLLELVSSDSRIEMLFKFRKSKNGWKAYDVEIMGVSVVQTYRSQFLGVLKKSGIEGLLSKMRQTGQFKIDTDKKK